MDMTELTELLLSPTALVALIIGIAELLKKAGVPARFIPICDLILGVGGGICVYGLMLHYPIANGALIGIAMGLSACGLFSGIKNTLGGYENAEKHE